MKSATKKRVSLNLAISYLNADFFLQTSSIQGFGLYKLRFCLARLYNQIEFCKNTQSTSFTVGRGLQWLMLDAQSYEWVDCLPAWDAYKHSELGQKMQMLSSIPASDTGIFQLLTIYSHNICRGFHRDARVQQCIASKWTFTLKQMDEFIKMQTSFFFRIMAGTWPGRYK